MMNNDIDIIKLEPMDLFPCWAYIKEEWELIVSNTIIIVDGTRYMNKEPEQQRSEDLDKFINDILL